VALKVFDPYDEESLDKMREFFNPSQVDQFVRQALQMCWMKRAGSRGLGRLCRS
jgi:hypothetical protein